MTTWLLVVMLLVLLSGFDLWLSQKRWKQGIADLNPVVQHFVKHQGVVVGLLVLLTINLLILAATSLWLPGLLILLGGKISLAALQLRSLIENGK